jgi:hypothetical protein
MHIRRLAPILAVIALVAVTGCGSSSSSGGSRTGASATSTGTEGSSALAADARSAATGDIPDSQNFLTFTDRHLGVSMVYPEGWTVKTGASDVTISDKNNVVRISLAPGPPPSVSTVQAGLAALKSTTPGLTRTAPAAITLKSGPAVKATYTTQSAPNPVTGTQVTLTVDRYALGHNGRVAIVDLGTPVGVDNVDAYKRMIESLAWR